MAVANAYPLIPVGVQVLVLSTQLFGILANIFFLYILLRYHRGWNPGKMLMMVFSVAALAFLLSTFFPLVVVVSTGRDLTAAECTAPVLIHQGASCALPLSLGVAAHLRWKSIQAVMNSKQAPNVKRYVCFMFAFIVALIVLATVTANGAPIEWDANFMFCVRLAPLYAVVFNLVLFVGAPYVFYCYRKIFAVVRGNAPDQSTQIVRAVFILVVFFYVTYLTQYAVAWLDFGLEAVSVSNFGFHMLGWTAFLHPAFSPVVSIITIPRYRAVAIDILKCQNVRILPWTKGLSAGSTGGTKKSVHSQRPNSKTSSTTVNVDFPPNTEGNPTTTPDTPKNKTETSPVLV